MPLAPLRLCSRPGCQVQTRAMFGGLPYCPVHIPGVKGRPRGSANRRRRFSRTFYGVLLVEAVPVALFRDKRDAEQYAKRKFGEPLPAECEIVLVDLKGNYPNAAGGEGGGR